MTNYSEIEIQTAKNLMEKGLKWIGRNQSGRLSAYVNKPSKVGTYWWAAGYSDCACDYVPIFQNIRFGDKEPTSLEAIVHPQILDDVERKYLSAVIRPFRSRVKYIAKIYADSMCAYKVNCYIFIHFNDGSGDMNFPVFQESDMYKGMKPDHAYTLEELGL